MIKVSVFYPNQEGSKFDMAYYCASHMPMVRPPPRHPSPRPI